MNSSPSSSMWVNQFFVRAQIKEIHNWTNWWLYTLQQQSTDHDEHLQSTETKYQNKACKLNRSTSETPFSVTAHYWSRKKKKSFANATKISFRFILRFHFFCFIRLIWLWYQFYGCIGHKQLLMRFNSQLHSQQIANAFSSWQKPTSQSIPSSILLFPFSWYS